MTSRIPVAPLVAIFAAVLISTSGFAMQSPEPARTGPVMRLLERMGLAQRGWLPYAQAIELQQTRRNTTWSEYVSENKLQPEAAGYVRFSKWQEGHRASAYMPEVLELIRRANTTALPRDAKTEKASRELFPMEISVLTNDVINYSHFLASQDRHAEGADALITMLHFCRNLRFGMLSDIRTAAGNAGSLADEAHRLLLTAPAEVAFRLGEEFLEASEWVKDSVLHPEFELRRVYEEKLNTERGPDDFLQLMEYDRLVNREQFLMGINDAIRRQEILAAALVGLRHQPLHTWQLPSTTSDLEDEGAKSVSDHFTTLSNEDSYYLGSLKKNSAKLRSVKIAALLRLYYWQHGEIPETLEKALPAELTIDTGMGAPYVYRRLDKLSFELGYGYKSEFGRIVFIIGGIPRPWTGQIPPEE